MKISIAQGTKRLANGEYPINVRVYSNGRYTFRSAGVSCGKANWNAKGGRVSSRDRGYKEKNELISQRLKEVEASYNESQQTAVTGKVHQKEIPSKGIPSKGIPSKEAVSGSDTEMSFYDVLQKKMDDCGTHSYRKNFMQLERFLKSHYQELPISSLNKEFMCGLIEKLESKSKSQHAKLMKHFNMVYRYGLENGYITDFKIGRGSTQRSERGTRKDDFLNEAELGVFLKLYAKMQGDDTDEKQREAVFLFALHLAFQGLAPIDMANLRLRDLKRETVRGDDGNLRTVVKCKTERQKTGQGVVIVVYEDDIKPILDYFTDGKGEDDYLINCFDKRKERDPKQKDGRKDNYYTKQAKYLNEAYKGLCEAENVIARKLYYYMARHTYTQTLFANKVPVGHIQILIGHRDKTLYQYYISGVPSKEAADINHELLKAV